MLRSIALVGFLAALAGVWLVGPSLLAADEPKDAPPFLKVMEDNFSGKKNVHKALKKAVDADPIDWGEVGSLTKQYTTAASFVGAHAKDKPEKGDDKSWAKLTTQFNTLSKDLDAAVVKKDKEQIKATIEKLQDTCEACHENHR
jgi:cytochrome c556